MSENTHDKKVFSLLEVMQSIQRTLSGRYGSTFWVQAEMNKLNHYGRTGHCYPDLVEKKDGNIIAQIRAYLWRKDYERVNNAFLKLLNEPLKDGIKILFQAKISFDPVHGLSLWIQDIDPSYTLGDLEKEKKETIQKLKEEGIFHQNKSLKLPLLPQRIAVISVETSKGYADFLKMIQNNSWGYAFFHLLFPSLLQGDNAAQQIIRQLNFIRKYQHHFDAVAIIRGGGGEVGLSCYNDYSLAREIALFPLPVLTGIGHSTNETVAELVAHVNTITPTQLGEFLIQKFHDFAIPVQNAGDKITQKSMQLIDEEKYKLNIQIRLFGNLVQSAITKNLNLVNRALLEIQKDAVALLKENNTQIGHLRNTVEILKPKNVLKRGYSITMLNGKSVTDTKQIKKGDSLETLIYNGKIISTVESVNKTNQS